MPGARGIGQATVTCAMCEIVLPASLMLPDGGEACLDVRWYCRDTVACTRRWTEAQHGPPANGEHAVSQSPADEHTEPETPADEQAKPETPANEQAKPETPAEGQAERAEPANGHARCKAPDAEPGLTEARAAE